MAWRSPRMLPIGVACDGLRAHATQWRLDRHGLRLHRAASWPLRDTSELWPQGEVDHLSAMLRRRRFAGRRVVLAAPAAMASAHLLLLPDRASGAPLPQLARMEAAAARKCGPEQLTVDLWDVPEPARGAEGSHVLAVACDTGAIEPVLARFDAAGLDVAALDWSALALQRMAAGQLPGGDGALLQLDWTGGLLVVVHRHVVVYERPIPELDLRRLHERLVHQMHVDASLAESLIVGDETLDVLGPEAASTGEGRQPRRELTALVLSHLADAMGELRAAFAFAAHRYPDCRLERLMLSGLGVSLPGLADYLGPELKVEVVTAGRGGIGPAQVLAGGLGCWAHPEAQWAPHVARQEVAA